MLRTLALLALLGCAMALDNGLGRVPAMGTNTWNSFRCSGINDANIRQVADAMVSKGLAGLGYKYLNIDDCWCTTRGSDGKLVPDPKAFPNGMKAVADYVHSKGLKFGIYTDRGPQTCAGRPASGGNEDIDAQTFADWGVDYLKEDSCHATSDHKTAFSEYGAMRDALNKTGRPIYFSLCGWNSWYAPVGYSLGNSWRIAGDCNEWPSIYNAIRVNEALYPYASPGGWNDPDMLVGSSPNAAVHNTEAQSRTQFSLWAVMAAPLLIGSNIPNMSDFDLETYSNKEVIAIDADPLGKQGRPVVNTCPSVDLAWAAAYADRHNTSALGRSLSVPSCQQVWARPLASGAVAVNMVNFDSNPATISCGADCFKAAGLSGSVKVRDVWQHKDLGTFSSYNATVDGDGASVTLIFTPTTLL